MVSHLFLHSEFSFFLWCRMIGHSVVLWCSSESIPSMLAAWRMAPFSRCGLVLWKIISFAIFWSLSKGRNARVFRGSSMPKEDVLFVGRLFPLLLVFSSFLVQ